MELGKVPSSTEKGKDRKKPKEEEGDRFGRDKKERKRKKKPAWKDGGDDRDNDKWWKSGWRRRPLSSGTTRNNTRCETTSTTTAHLGPERPRHWFQHPMEHTAEGHWIPNTTKRCNLCLAEKVEIISADKVRSLNKKTELIKGKLHSKIISSDMIEFFR